MQLEGNGHIDMNCDVTKFSVSWVTIRVVAIPVRRFVGAWNAHTIPGSRGGIPNVLARTSSRIARLTASHIPTVDAAVESHEANGGREVGIL